MTATELQQAVVVLANGGWCRYWLAYNIDARGQSIMAVQCRDENGTPRSICDAMSHGFQSGPNYFYTIKRTNKDGTPYISRNEDEQ